MLALKSLLFRFWPHILAAIVVGLIVWHYMDLRSDRAAARADAQAQRVRADNAWAQVRRQNEAIGRLNALNQTLSQNIGQIVTRNTTERRELDTLMNSMRGRINQLLNTPSAPTPEAQCEAAREELTNVEELSNLLRPR